MPTVVSHVILVVFTLGMLQQMADPTADEVSGGAGVAPSDEGAAAAAERFFGLSSDIRGCAILGPDGVIAATGERAPWLEAGRALLAAADRASGTMAVHAHVATEDGEAYAVRASGLEMVAVTDRFTLASLVLADMRGVLRATVAASAEVA